MVRQARNRTQLDKEFPTLKLFWELGQNKYKAKTQEYIKLNKHRIDEIRYIFKMGIGCNESKETLYTRKLIQEEELNCHWCGTPETRKHIIMECEIYNSHRNNLMRKIN